ncbi:MAG: PAS domain S-box protein, partial [Actinomycetota bacterium]|nr:PAS domain S-box protein [Actinomycetota bacterium]
MGALLFPARQEGPDASFQAVFDALPDAVLVIAEDGVIRLANGAAETLFGYARQDLVGRDHRLILPDAFSAGQEQHIAALRLSHSSGSPASLPFDAYGRRKDGSEFQGEVASSLLDSDEGTLLVASIRPAFHRQEADDGLREAMSLLSATLESTADGILVVSTDGKIAGINDQFSSMWRIPREMLVARDDEAVMQYVLAQLSDPAT